MGTADAKKISFEVGTLEMSEMMTKRAFILHIRFMIPVPLRFDVAEVCIFLRKERGVYGSDKMI